jgi:transposase/predicted GNAT family acetyltransferase
MPDDHLAYQIRDVVQALDLSAIHRWHMKDPRGALPLDPVMMVSVQLYAWCSNVYSARNTAGLCVADLGGRYLSAGHQPDFRTISTFRLRHGEALADLFVQSVRLCQAAGMVSLGHVAIDGTKLMANASKHKAMSYGRMVTAEEILRAEIDEIQRRCAEEDAQEDTLFGKEKPGYDLPKELKFRESRLAHILAAKARLEADAKAAVEAKAAERERERRQSANNDDEPDKPRRGRKPKDPATASPKETAQSNFTDPESRIMKSGTGDWVQGYNGQAAVDSDHQVIVACDLTDMAADAPHFLPMLEQVIENTGAEPVQKSADAGYFSKANVEAKTTAFSETFIPPDRMKHGRASAIALAAVEERNDGDTDLSTADRMRKRLLTPEGHKAYAVRKKTVEPVFGQIKGCPGSPGFRQFMRRGIEKTRQEWRWICAAHNFLKYIRHGFASQMAD